MEGLDDIELLRRYAADGSEAAFETLVARRIGFVYSAALRQVRDADHAKEVTQAVFTILARKAGMIHGQRNLSGWLFKTTRFVALSQMRAATRRHHYEQEAQLQADIQSTVPDSTWEQMSPLLDEALAQLGEKDRQALLLRFFEEKSHAEVGLCLGDREETARMRVSRALEKLRRYFLKRGIASTAAIIAGALSAHSVKAAPASLAKSVATAAIAKGAASSVSTLTLVHGTLKLMAWTKVKTAIVVGVSVLLTVGVVDAALEIKARADRKKDPVLFEITHRSLLQKLFPRPVDENALRAQMVGTWEIEAKKFGDNPGYTYFPHGRFALLKKTWTMTNWSIVTYDTNGDVVYSAGGTYRLKGNVYNEIIETATGEMTNYIGNRPFFFIAVKDGKYYQMNTASREMGHRVSQ